MFIKGSPKDLIELLLKRLERKGHDVVNKVPS